MISIAAWVELACRKYGRPDLIEHVRVPTKKEIRDAGILRQDAVGLVMSRIREAELTLRSGAQP